MTSSEKTLVCGRCEIVPKTILVEGGLDRVVCSRCGLEADLKVALELAGKHFLYAHDGPLKSFQDRQVRSTRRLKNVKYVPGPLPRIGTPDFIFK